MVRLISQWSPVPARRDLAAATAESGLQPPGGRTRCSTPCSATDCRPWLFFRARTCTSVPSRSNDRRPSGRSLVRSQRRCVRGSGSGQGIPFGPSGSAVMRRMKSQARAPPPPVRDTYVYPRRGRPPEDNSGRWAAPTGPVALLAPAHTSSIPSTMPRIVPMPSSMYAV
jgi:hypothetical protein